MRQLNQIIIAMLAMSGRVTMLVISRWTGTGGSYRTMLRFFHTVIPWATLFWLLDGHFGNNSALQMARQVNLHIISKLRHDSALYIPYQNPDPNRRSRRKYGDKLDYCNIPDAYLCKSAIDEDIKTDIYQATLLHKALSRDARRETL
jgi:hypothetical protein